MCRMMQGLLQCPLQQCLQVVPVADGPSRLPVAGAHSTGIVAQVPQAECTAHYDS